MNAAVTRDLALVRDPSLAFTLTQRQLDSLSGTTRDIVALIAEYPWVSTNMSVADAALFAFGVSDDFIEYLHWLQSAPMERAA